MTIHLIDEADLRLKRPEPERGIETLLGASVISPVIVTALAVGGGTGTGATTFHHNSFGAIISSVDRTSWGNTAGFTQQSAMVVIGV